MTTQLATSPVSPTVNILEPTPCDALRNPGQLNFVVSIILAIGIVVSYLPQHVRIIRRKSSEGISPWFLLLGVSSGTCAFCNILLLSRPIISCCPSVSPFECFASTLGIVQIGLQATMAAVILILALLCTNPANDAENLPPATIPLAEEDQYVRIVVVSQVCLVHFLLTATFAAYTFFFAPKYIEFTANLMGVTAAVLAMIQYFPQIYTTFTLKHAGSLSIPMMLMQTPGGFIWTASLAAREGTTWSSWLPYLTAASLQLVVLLMAIYFEKVKRGQPTGENAPLLAHDDE